MTKFTIPQGYRGLKKDCSLNITEPSITLITGLNGAGKTRILRYISEEHPSKSFLKTTQQNIYYNNRRRYLYTTGNEEDSYTTVQEVINALGRACEFFIRRKNPKYKTSHLDLFRCLFDSKSNLYRYKKDFAKFSQLVQLLDNINVDSNDFFVKIGIPTESSIKKIYRKELIKKIKDKKNSVSKYLSKAEKKQVNDTMKNPITEDTLYKYAEEQAKAKAEKKAEIINQETLEKYIFDKLNPFENVEFIVNKLTRLINEERGKYKSGKNKYIWEKINNILNGKKENGTDLDNYKLSNEINTMFKYKLKEPTNYNNYELIFIPKDGGNANSVIGFSDLSSGEKAIFELICYVYVLPSFSSKLEYLLLDEFDAYFNPSLSKLYIQVLQEYLGNLSVILTSHSPSTVAYIDEKSIFWMEDDMLDNSKNKMEILDKLLPGMNVSIGMRDSLHTLCFRTDPLKKWHIFTEGETDILHIKTACKKLENKFYENILDNCNFNTLNGAGDEKAKSAMLNRLSYDNDRKIIVLCDYDTNGMKLFCEIKERNKNIKKQNDNLFALHIMPPEDTTFEKQKSNGYFPIELLYEEDILKEHLGDSYREYNDNKISSHYYLLNKEALKAVKTNGTNVNDFWFLKKDNKKEDFAKNINTLSPDKFNGFIPTLDTILEIINKNNKK